MGSAPAGDGFTLSAEELGGDLPMVCAVTGRPAEVLTPVWFARSPWWAWAPLAVLVVLAVFRGAMGTIASLWGVGALLAPVLLSRGVAGRMPLDESTRRRLQALRGRRLRVVISALLLTWVSVGLWLIGSRAGGILVLALVLALYAVGAAMALYGRLLTVRGWPEADGGATIRNAHPSFVQAVELHRTGHRP